MNRAELCMSENWSTDFDETLECFIFEDEKLIWLGVTPPHSKNVFLRDYFLTLL